MRRTQSVPFPGLGQGPSLARSLFPGLAPAPQRTLHVTESSTSLHLILVLPSFLRQLAETFEIRPK